jgi:RNA polymerase sigma factor (sigma-70 family)
MIKQGNDWFLLFKEGKEHAFRQVFDQYYRSVSYFALKILQDDPYAEDIVSETFNKAWNARAKFKTARHLENFLYLVTRNGCISYLRSTQLTHVSDPEWIDLASGEDPEATPLDLEQVQARLMTIIFEKLQQVPGGDVLRMSFIDGKTTKEIAMALNITENNVYLIKHRGLKALRSVLSSKEWMFFLLLSIKYFVD